MAVKANFVEVHVDLDRIVVVALGRMHSQADQSVVQGVYDGIPEDSWTGNVVGEEVDAPFGSS